MVSFGDNIDGMGFGEMIAGVEEMSSPSIPKQVSEQQELITQETEKSVVVPKQQTKPKTKPVTITEQELQQQELQRRDAAAAAEAKRRQ